VAQKQPATGEDPVHLLRVDLRLDKDAAADQAVLAIDQTAEICHHATPLCYCLALFASRAEGLGSSFGIAAAQRLAKKCEIA
jgi:hypothetical protein